MVTRNKEGQKDLGPRRLRFICQFNISFCVKYKFPFPLVIT